MMAFDATFRNISAICWRQVLLVEETGVIGENLQPDASFGCFVPMIADHDLVKKSFGSMIADHDLVKKR
jgi:hypothetical protein